MFTFFGSLGSNHPARLRSILSVFPANCGAAVDERVGALDAPYGMAESKNGMRHSR